MTIQCHVLGCENRQGEGGFAHPAICVPCANMLSYGDLRHGKTFIHTLHRNHEQLTEAVKQFVRGELPNGVGELAAMVNGADKNGTRYKARVTQSQAEIGGIWLVYTPATGPGLQHDLEIRARCGKEIDALRLRDAINASEGRDIESPIERRSHNDRD